MLVVLLFLLLVERYKKYYRSPIQSDMSPQEQPIRRLSAGTRREPRGARLGQQQQRNTAAPMALPTPDAVEDAEQRIDEDFPSSSAQLDAFEARLDAGSCLHSAPSRKSARFARPINAKASLHRQATGSQNSSGQQTKRDPNRNIVVSSGQKKPISEEEMNRQDEEKADIADVRCLPNGDISDSDDDI